MASQFATGAYVEFRTKKNNPDVPGVEDITPDELLAQKDKVTVVDVRRPDEFTAELGHVPGALHMVLDTLPQRIAELPKDQTIVFVCRSGGRSARASAFARENGFTSVYNMQGGMLLWNEKGLPVEGRNE